MDINTDELVRYRKREDPDARRTYRQQARLALEKYDLVQASGVYEIQKAVALPGFAEEVPLFEREPKVAWYGAPYAKCSSL